MNKEEMVVAAIKAACGALAEGEGGSVDYNLEAVANMVGGEVVGDAINLDGFSVEMDGDTWVEMGHQYSTMKQWWPMQ